MNDTFDFGEALWFLNDGKRVTNDEMHGFFIQLNDNKNIIHRYRDDGIKNGLWVPTQDHLLSISWRLYTESKEYIVKYYETSSRALVSAGPLKLSGDPKKKISQFLLDDKRNNNRHYYATIQGHGYDCVVTIT